MERVQQRYFLSKVIDRIFSLHWSRSKNELEIFAKFFSYLAAYSAINPRMKGKEIPTSPATAIGIFSSSDILSVFL